MILNALNYRFSPFAKRPSIPPPPLRVDLERSVDSLRQLERPPASPIPLPPDDLVGVRELLLDEREQAIEQRERALNQQGRELRERTRELLEEAMLLDAREKHLLRREQELGLRLEQLHTEHPAAASPKELAERDEVISALEALLRETEGKLRQRDQRIMELTADLDEASNHSGSTNGHPS